MMYKVTNFFNNSSDSEKSSISKDIEDTKNLEILQVGTGIVLIVLLIIFRL